MVFPKQIFASCSKHYIIKINKFESADYSNYTNEIKWLIYLGYNTGTKNPHLLSFICILKFAKNIDKEENSLIMNFILHSGLHVMHLSRVADT